VRAKPYRVELFCKQQPLKLQWKSYPAGNAIEFLESLGLIDAQLAQQTVATWPTEKLENAAADLYDYLFQRENLTPDPNLTTSPFDLLASASLRGDSGCFRLECRSVKLATLARYTAMYADRVFLPVPLVHPSAGSDHGDIRYEFCRTVFSILQLRPLVENMIVRPIVSAMHYCRSCAERELSQYQNGTQAAQLQARRHYRDFEFYCLPSIEGFGVPGVLIKGPDEYVEHGSMIKFFLRRPRWFPLTRKTGKSHRLSRATAEKAGLLEEIFGGIASDVCFHQSFQTLFNAAYLTDLPGEAEFLKILSERDEIAIRTAKICAQLVHEIPMLTDLPIRTVIKIRNESAESFDLYRATLRKLVLEYIAKNQPTSEQVAREIYQDVLQPAITQLRVEAVRQRRIWTRKSTLTAGFALGVISLYATGVLQSPQVLALLGGGTLTGLLGQLAEPARVQAASSSSLYFLLRLDDEAKRQAQRAA
jgi:hypothetical protein